MSLPLSRRSERQESAFSRCAALAVSRELRVLWRGSVRAGVFAGSRCWGVSSASRPGSAHVVWLWRGHLLCSCPAGANERVVCCSHSALVALSLAVAAAPPASVPASVPAGVASSVVAPSGAAAAADAGAEWAPIVKGPVTHCPRCMVATDPDELAQLGGECLDCLLDMRDHEARDEERKRHGREEAAKRIIATEKAKQETYRRHGRTAQTDIRLDPTWQEDAEERARERQREEAQRQKDTAIIADNRAFSVWR